MSAIVASLLLASLSEVPVFPVATGETWVYEGKVAWTEENSNRTHSRRITWEASVVRVFKTNDHEATVIRGFPTDLAWYSPGQEAGYTVLLQTGSGLFIANEANESTALATAADAAAGKDVGEQVLRYPLMSGTCVGQDPDRIDRRYCWALSRASSRRSSTVWIVSYSTNADDQRLEFTPGVGVTRYTYLHHGTVASVDVRLKTRRAK